MSELENQLNPSNLAFVEGLFEDYVKDPLSVPLEWQGYFSREVKAGRLKVKPAFKPRSIFHGVPQTNGHGPGNGQSLSNGQSIAPASKNGSIPPVSSGNGKFASAPVRASSQPPPIVAEIGPDSARPNGAPMDLAMRQDRVDQLVRAYRVRGHMIAKLDPLDMPRPAHPELEPAYYHLTQADLERSFSSRTISGTETLTLREILDHLRNTYCRSIGVELMHIHDIETKNWVQERMESSQNRLDISTEQQRHIFTMLTDATLLEEFIQKKFLGAKSFSLEGSESLIPLLHWAIERAADHGVDEITLGMAHRGRLNVLANIMGKSPREIFREFEDRDPQLYRGRGDVKYHLGYSSDFQTLSGKNVHLSLCFNPSHLEYVNTVVQGRVRAKQDRFNDAARERKMAILIHGDAAFAGEGIVQETLNMSELGAYHVGGTIHVIVNNQIGFTTSPNQARSTTYCTDVAKMLQIPIFHVNGEDPEAVAQVVNMALEFRAKFRRDIVIDMYGYRRHGHNETDEPAFTQPLLYKAISNRKSVRDGYLEHLLGLGGFTREQADQVTVERREHLDRELSEARASTARSGTDWLLGYWNGFKGGPESDVEDVDTTVPVAELTSALNELCDLPEGFTPHKKLERLLASRREMAQAAQPLDWGAAELAALATLLKAGAPVRMTGQDVERGTFSHRHAVVHDINTGASHMPLAHLRGNPARIELANSPLSEASVLGYEWGYSLDCPEGLVVWEAQFGDFCNAAQVIIDQFICSAEDKWNRLSGLVLLLPHGFEGMGPEHSSARMERFLVLAAQDNMQIAQPTNPAQMFHLLRRQVLRKWRKPLVVFTPKSLLRHPKATNTLQEVASGRFHRVIEDNLELEPEQVTRVLLCTGKVYYELAKHREDLGRKDVAIVRIEQLYPLPKKGLAMALEQYAAGTQVIWVQEEPENMGAWAYMRMNLGERVFGRYPLSRVTRNISSSPATGSASSHRIEQQELIDAAFGVA